jgi:hypothetical protein
VNSGFFLKRLKRVLFLEILLSRKQRVIRNKNLNKVKQLECQGEDTNKQAKVNKL